MQCNDRTFLAEYSSVAVRTGANVETRTDSAVDTRNPTFTCTTSSTLHHTAKYIHALTVTSFCPL